MKARSVSRLQLGGNEYAVVPWAEYQRLLAKGKVKLLSHRRLSAEDVGDVAEVRRHSREPNKPYNELRGKLSRKSGHPRLTVEDRRNARKVAQAVARYRAGKLQTVNHESLKRSLGF